MTLVCPNCVETDFKVESHFDLGVWSFMLRIDILQIRAG